MDEREAFEQSSVKQNLEDVWGDTTTCAQEQLSEDFTRYKKYKTQKFLAAFLILVGTPVVIICTLMVAALTNLESLWGPYVVMFFTAVCVAAFFLLRIDFSFSVQRFNYQLNKLLYPVVYQTLGVEGSHDSFFTNRVAENAQSATTAIHSRNILEPIWRKFGYQAYELNTGLHREILQIASDSGLIVDQASRMYVDDVYEFTVSNIPCRLAEVDFENSIRARGKEYKIPVTKGYLAQVDLASLNRHDNNENQVFITSETDTKLFSNKYFWEFLHFPENNQPQDISATWVDAAEYIRIAAIKPDHAQSMLSESFIKTVHEYVEKTSNKIRISLIGNHMYVLIPSSGVSINEPISELSTEALQSHALETAESIDLVAHLIKSLSV